MDGNTAAGEIDAAQFGRWINLAGRQRMLSQRIGLNLLIAIGEGGPDASTLETLDAAVGQFVEAHQTLFATRSGPSPLAIAGGQAASAYEQGQPSAHNVIDAFIAEMTQILSGLKRGQRPGAEQVRGLVPGRCNDVLAAMNRITLALEQDMAAATEARARQASERATRISAAARDIDGAARFSRTIALNAKIAAVRAGSVGVEFAALTEELKSIADRIQASSSCIIFDVGQSAA